MDRTVNELRRVAFFCLMSVVAFACQDGMRLKKSSEPSGQDQGSGTYPGSWPTGFPGAGYVAYLSNNQVFCQLGPEIAALAKKSDYSQDFDYLCKEGNTTGLFEHIFNSAYKGVGVPQVFDIAKSLDGTYSTLVNSFAIIVPVNLETVALRGVYRNLAPGFTSGNTEIDIAVTGTTQFPGKKSVESIDLMYTIKRGDGVAVNSIRKTQSNLYLLQESNTKVAMINEVLTEKNDDFLLSNGIGMVSEIADNETAIIMVSRITVNNRGLPDNTSHSIRDIMAGIAQKSYHQLASPPRP